MDLEIIILSEVSQTEKGKYNKIAKKQMIQMEGTFNSLFVRVTNSSQFVWDFPGFSIERSASRAPPQSQANWDCWSPYQPSRRKLRLREFRKFVQDHTGSKQQNCC